MPVELFKEKAAITHPGKFHADDVFASAFLKLLNRNIEILRTSSIPKTFNGIVFDIGYGEFDHHQKNNEVRPNGIPYASFGKLWKKFSHHVVDPVIADNIDKNLVQPLDAADNGKGSNLLSIMISKFNPAWNEDDTEEEEYFDYAVSVALNILLSEIEIEKRRMNGDITEPFHCVNDVNETIVSLFSNPVIRAMTHTESGSKYIDEIKRCVKFECGKTFPCDQQGEPCSPLSNVWREYGTITTFYSVAGSVQRSFFGALDDAILKNKKDDVLLCVMADIQKHLPGRMTKLNDAIYKWLSSEIEAAESRLISRERLIEAVQNTEDDEIIILDKFYPWREILIDSLAKFVVYPSVRGGYSMHTVPVSRIDPSARLSFPAPWCSMSIDKLQQEAPDVIFCHKGNFLITSRSLEGCYRAAEAASKYFIETNFNEHDIYALEIAKKTNFFSSSAFEQLAAKLTIVETDDLLDKFEHIYLRNPEEKANLDFAKSILQKHTDAQKFLDSRSKSLDELLNLR